MWLLWQQHLKEEDWGFLLIDMRNSFNEENLNVILWEFWHDWTSGKHSDFNCY